MTQASSPSRRQAVVSVEKEKVTVEALFRDHFDGVYRLVGRLLGPGAPVADIEDLAQQVFVNATRALPRFRGDCKGSTWLYGIATHTTMTWIRGLGRRRRLEQAVLREPTPTASSADAIERDVENRRELARVWRALMKLSDKKRSVYLLHEIEGLPGSEVAAALGIPEATVWTRLHHARRDLLRALERAPQGVKP